MRFWRRLCCGKRAGRKRNFWLGGYWGARKKSFDTLDARAFCNISSKEIVLRLWLIVHDFADWRVPKLKNFSCEPKLKNVYNFYWLTVKTTFDIIVRQYLVCRNYRFYAQNGFRSVFLKQGRQIIHIWKILILSRGIAERLLLHCIKNLIYIEAMRSMKHKMDIYASTNVFGMTQRQTAKCACIQNSNWSKVLCYWSSTIFIAIFLLKRLQTFWLKIRPPYPRNTRSKIFVYPIWIKQHRCLINSGRLHCHFQN